MNDSCLTITSPGLEDKGNYLCKVANAVGSVFKDMLLGTVYNLKIDTFKRVFSTLVHQNKIDSYKNLTHKSLITYKIVFY